LATVRTDRVDELLASVSWDFADASARASIHSMHPYPARFIPEIPHALIRLFPPPSGTSVLDPFCGSGTTLVEAQDTGIESIGIDLHPLASLISRVKTRPPTGNVLIEGHHVEVAARRTPTEVPEIPRLDHWFQPEVQEALAAIAAQVGAVPDQTLRDALSVALARIIVRVSNQESDTRYAAVMKEVSGETVFAEFAKSVQFVSATLSARFDGMFGPRSAVRVINADIRDVLPGELPRVGLVVTSPPYPNAYEYWLYHKYRMYWLGMDPIAVRRSEIGARPHYFRKNPQMEFDFELAMQSTFGLIAEVLVEGGVACFLVGNSIIHGEEVDNLALLERAAKTRGLVLLGVTTRRINPNRKAFNKAIGRIQHEALAVFGRED
jgi:DNA modification methylase